ncbi:hypothetical protein EJ07DRAFT_168840 [Lizonia empirigonia]|nr:hypothetical protein EJ07DRAFT_168840 [Lizonia empirigonia]
MAQRRTHKKSKLGSQDCKRRHIKCDEGRPACINCITTERECVYQPARPRKVHSAAVQSPQSSTSAVGPNSAATSPSRALLVPALSGTASVSTPSSFAAAPVSNLNVRHMELLSNFMLETAPSLDMREAIDLSLIRTLMPAILSAPYLLLQVLALSALHLSQTTPAQADSYHADATALQVEALTTFDDYIGNINTGNCEAMLMFTSFLSTYSLGEAVMTSENDADGFLDRFVTYLNLHRGVQTVTSQAWAMLLQSKISLVLNHASDQLSLAASHAPERAVSVADHLSHLLDAGDLNAESNTACRDAVSRLKLMYQAEYLNEQSTDSQQPSSRLIWA